MTDKEFKCLLEKMKKNADYYRTFKSIEKNLKKIITEDSAKEISTLLIEVAIGEIINKAIKCKNSNELLRLFNELPSESWVRDIYWKCFEILKKKELSKIAMHKTFEELRNLYTKASSWSLESEIYQYYLSIEISKEKANKKISLCKTKEEIERLYNEAEPRSLERRIYKKRLAELC